jgi:hypothetical protein
VKLTHAIYLDLNPSQVPTCVVANGLFENSASRERYSHSLDEVSLWRNVCAAKSAIIAEGGRVSTHDAAARSSTNEGGGSIDMILGISDSTLGRQSEEVETE